MQARLTLSLALTSLLLAACSSSSNSPRAVATPAATNANGSPVTGVLTVRFDPTAGKVPLPNNLLLSGTTDLTLNPPVVNPANFADPLVAVSSLDGWSTVAPLTFQFQGGATPEAASVVAGTSVRMFEVALTGPGGAVTRIIRELATPAEFVTAVTTIDARDTNGVASQGVAILPTRPLKQLTSYMTVVTDGIRDTLGNDATPDQTYFLSKRTSPLCTGGVSTDPLLPSATACALEPLRQLTNAQLAAAAGAGINRDRVVVSWVATTQAITPVLQAVKSRVTPQPHLLVPTGTNTGVVPGLPAVADIFVGFLSLPYYLQPPTAANPTGPLTGFWRAAPGAYVPPFNALGLSPTSTNITFANPFPVANATVRVPVLMTVPNAASGQTRPLSGWPIVIFQHGVTRNRTDMLAISAAMAARGFVVVAIDQPLHGVSPGNSDFARTAPFYVSSTNPLTAPLAAAGVVERTFNVDYQNNSTGASGPDGIPERSGNYSINLGSLLTARDNLRQAQADLFVLAATAPRFDLDGNGTPDIDSSRMVFVGQSLGSIVGIPFLAFEPTVNVGLLSVPGGGIAQMLNGSVEFGPIIRGGLAAGGVVAGTPQFNQFLGAAQQVLDAADPINYGFLTATDAIVLHEVVGGGGSPASLPDQVIPNSVPGAPLSGTEPLIRALGLATITATTQSANGVRGAVRFTRGSHGSLLDPTTSLPAFLEMQGQMASFLASGGAEVRVQDTSVIRTP